MLTLLGYINSVIRKSGYRLYLRYDEGVERPKGFGLYKNLDPEAGYSKPWDFDGEKNRVWELSWK
jgi:hypothetical protein